MVSNLEPAPIHPRALRSALRRLGLLSRAENGDVATNVHFFQTTRHGSCKACDQISEAVVVQLRDLAS